MRAIAVIPARGGSKRIPRKNIKDFCGLPIIAHSINTALESGCFEKVVVSTDDQEIANIALQHGAEVPFLRPHLIADDYSGTIPVIAHAIDFFKHQNQFWDYVCCLYATAPFVRAEDIRAGASLISDEKSVEQNIRYVFSVAEYSYPIQRALHRKSSGFTSMLNPENFNLRSQDLISSYHDAGQFYWGKADAWLNQEPIFNVKALSVVLPHYRVQDIDTLDDWKRAELMHQALMQTGD
ncbi:pseudaminic acid cytidylyltransferase [Alkanindiges hydrocarboniclasticus]|jgi:pseudaminic acid cytidylyltransferase|uniref:Pseudaminic acid cytidylyltransferase n=1 Tax=Alkanindiges hydrocarboniclasticus TaxID=1907941 RepID=A0A1S8CWG0_9GAMM|nr:pseudaminic acid cytidylyltransferase [Alkanindiges hydrocarboniclasticus]ONG40588.1 pseudaminic acid cytidylyltransferase [Alkanindiges hydrocarboniclasticus]